MRLHFVAEFALRLISPRFALVVPAVLTLALALVSGLVPLQAANAVLATYAAVSFGDEQGGATQTIWGSGGFISIPTARALLSLPRWSVAVQAPGPISAQTSGQERLGLAILGMPVDVNHTMLSSTTIQNACVTVGQTGFSLCTGARLYDRDHGRFNLCDYSNDCWHSTAIAVLALGNSAQPSADKLVGARYSSTTLQDIARDSSNDDMSPAQWFHHLFPGFEKIKNKHFQVADASSNDNSKQYFTHQMLIDRGIDPGAPLFSVNVFHLECDKQSDSCNLLTTKAAQEQALQQIVHDISIPDPGGTRVRLGAIVIVGAGYLTATRCDDTTSARLIGELRQRGVLTFVAAGNDGNPTHVRFPACASQAIAIGSLTRDGAILPSSNGSKTGMVSLYVDGETVALPLRGPRVHDPAYDEPHAGCDHFRNCPRRSPKDQYDAYVAGGTLLSAAVASGIFLDLRQRYPSAAPEAVLAALRSDRLSSNPGLAEIDERMAAQRLAGHALPY